MVVVMLSAWGPTNLQTDLYSSDLEVEVALFVWKELDNSFRETILAFLY
jgi:hypothetical protein